MVQGGVCPGSYPPQLVLPREVPRPQGPVSPGHQAGLAAATAPPGSPDLAFYSLPFAHPNFLGCSEQRTHWTLP